MIGTGLGWTLALGGVSLVISFALGTLLGVVAAWRRHGRIDSWLPPALSFLGAFPYFWLAMLVLYVFGFMLRLVPAAARVHDPDLRGRGVADVLRRRRAATPSCRRPPSCSRRWAGGC